jgi:hypothetical protein
VSQCRSSDCGHLFLEERPLVSEAPGRELGELLAHHPNRNRRLVAYLHGEGMVGPGRRVIEYGPGGGHMALAVREVFRSATVSCVEADPAVQVHLRTLGLDVFDEVEDAPFDHDTLLLVDVLETLDDPVAVVSQLAKKLQPGGRAFVATPIGETRRGDHCTPAYESPTHVQFFTERSLDLAMRLAGLSSFCPRVVNPLYPRHQGLRGEARDVLVGASRHAWTRFFGPRHLTGFATRVA